MKRISTMHQQSGAVSIFVVIFAILLMSVVTISFLRIMVNDQNRAANNDLAQSAYDSAQAGVEDAKRALLWYTDQCKTLTPGQCSDLGAQMATTQCNAAIVNVAKVGVESDKQGGAGIGEVKVQAGVDASAANPDAALNQAYTCVTMTLRTDDYVGNLSVNQPVLIPLIGTSSFKNVTVEWYSRDDVSNSDGNVVVPAASASQQLRAQADWPHDTPPVLRAQYMQVGGNFTLDAFDFYRSNADPAAIQSGTNTLFLYPKAGGNTSAVIAERDIRQAEGGNQMPAGSSSAPYPVLCDTNVSAGGYACSVELRLPQAMGGGDAQTAYLLLTPLYAATHYRVTLTANDGSAVLFNGVQPIVDSTGRASDLFRRVQSRIDLYATNPFIGGAVDVSGSFCKDFSVTDTAYVAGSCTP